MEKISYNIYAVGLGHPGMQEQNNISSQSNCVRDIYMSGKQKRKLAMDNRKTFTLSFSLLSAYILLLSALTSVGCYAVEEKIDKNGLTKKDDFIEGDSGSEEVETESDTVDTESDTGTETEEEYINYCLALDGDGDYVRIRQDDDLVVSGIWTMEAWVWYVNDGSDCHPVFRGADESTSISSYYMYTEYDDLPYMDPVPMVGFGYSARQHESLYKQERMASEEWVHMAFVHDEDSHRFYLDGQLIDEVESDLDARPVADDVIIGAILHPNKTEYLHGYVDEIRLSSVARYDENFSPAIRHELDDDTIVLWNFDVEYNDDYTMDAAARYKSEFQGDTHIVERQWDME